MQKNNFKLLQKEKIHLYLHPLYGGMAEGMGRKGEPENILKKVWLGVGEEEKMITFAARFGGIGGRNWNGRSAQRGGRDIPEVL